MPAKPKRPGIGWTKRPSPPQLSHAEVWQHESGLQAISAVEIVEDAGVGLVARPAYHVSAIRWNLETGQRRACTDVELDQVREAFQMDGADEDNHGPGIARHLWIDVGARVEKPCPCKQDEPTTVDGPREWRP